MSDCPLRIGVRRWIGLLLGVVGFLLNTSDPLLSVGTSGWIFCDGHV